MGTLFFFSVGGGSVPAVPTPASAELTARQMVIDALIELGVLNATDPPSGEDLDLGLRWLNQLLDRWNAEGRASYREVFDPFTLTAGLNPHTCGPSGTFNLTQRPQDLEAVAVQRSGLWYPLEKQDAGWWFSLADPDVDGMPTDFYYDPDWPLGKLHLYPKPDAADPIRLARRVVLAGVVAETVISLPPGYVATTRLTLAEDLAGPFRVPMPETLEKRAAKARSVVFDAKGAPRISTWDPGMPGGGGGSWDWRTGMGR